MKKENSFFKRNKEKMIFVSLIVMVLLFIVNLIMILQIKNDDDSFSNSNNQASSIKISDDTTKVVKKVNDSVVTVALYQGDELIGNGSGSIISYKNNKAKIVTNNHVVDVESNITIKIIFSNKKEVKAKILGKDAISDLALLEVTTNFKVTPIEIGDSDKLQAGESVIAIGSPLDTEFSGTVTKGIISGVNRTIETDTNGDNIPDYAMQALQTDTTINPGNSGGPLINMAGQMVGINTSKISQTGFEGMGFSIPSNEAVTILKQLEKNGKVDRPTLGISYQAVSAIPEYAYDRFNIPSNIEEGLYIVEIVKNSAAAKAGLKADDIIFEVEGEKITSTSIFTSKLYSKKNGDKLKLKIYRDGKEKTITVTL
ncbi:serine protease Do [Bacilli bacterium PM5-9]|nr:serine protease Do [Bacilli bacterium PM5-9]